MGVYPYAWLRRPNKEYWSEMKEDFALKKNFLAFYPNYLNEPS